MIRKSAEVRQDFLQLEFLTCALTVHCNIYIVASLEVHEVLLYLCIDIQKVLEFVWKVRLWGIQTEVGNVKCSLRSQPIASERSDLT